MCRGKRPGLLSNSRGFTLVEMLVALGIMAILAAVAIPYAETITKRTNEMELRSALRTIRTAINRFSFDAETGYISKYCDCYSENGYPKNLGVLLEGIEGTGPVKKRTKYLRRIPRDPFADQSLPVQEQWGIRSYTDEHDSRFWNGEDVYDVFTKTERKAIDGSNYADW